MDIKDFYSFDSKLVSSTVQVHESILNKDKKNNLIYGDYESITFPLLFKQAYGSKLQDVLDTGWAGLYLISSKMKSILEDNNLTGWKPFEVKVLDKKGIEIMGYHGFSVKGRCGKIDYSQSEIIEKRFVTDGPKVKFCKGLYISLDSWDGSDFFLAENTLIAIVSKKAAEVLQKSKLTNIRLKNLVEIETDYSIVKLVLKDER